MLNNNVASLLPYQSIDLLEELRRISRASISFPAVEVDNRRALIASFTCRIAISSAPNGKADSLLCRENCR